MDYSKLTKDEMLHVIGTMKTVDKNINIEWRKRYGMNAPYRLTGDGVIKNCLIDAFVADSECDQIVLDQAIILRNDPVEIIKRMNEVEQRQRRTIISK